MLKPLPNKPIFADAFVPNANEPDQFLVVSPYDFTAAYQNNAHSSSNEDGGLSTNASPTWESSAWAWAGVGFPLVPDQDRTYRIQPVFACDYAVSLVAMWWVSTHIGLSAKIHVHRYDRDWQDTEEIEDYSKTVLSHTTATHYYGDGEWEICDPVFFVPLRGDSNYLIWGAIELYGNCTPPSSGFSGRFRARCMDIGVNIPGVF